MKQLAHKILVLCMIAVLGCGIYIADGRSAAQAASGARIYITPMAANYTIGQEFNAVVRVSSPSPINAVFANLYYNGRGLQVLSISRGADFPNQNVATKHTPGPDGKIAMQSTRNSTTSGDKHYATIRFRATAAGSWGFRPGTDSHVINYPSNTVSFTIGRADFVVRAPAPAPPVTPPVTPPTQPTNPTPKPTPTPTPKPAPKPTTPSTPRAPSGGTTPDAPTEEMPTESPTSDTGLQVTDLTISNLRYHGALLTWNTTKPTPTKINFGTNPDDLSNEQLTPDAVTQHSMEVDSTKLKAGSLYYVRVTGEDEGGPVTVDSEFTTKPIAVVVKVTDKDSKPVVGATLTVNDVVQDTDENGEATLDLPEGDVTIFAQKDEFSQETPATILVPESDDAPIQRISLALSEQSAATKITAIPEQKKSPILFVLIPIFLLAGGFVAFLIWRKRRQNTYYLDPLEAENYSLPVIPSTPVPIPTSIQQTEVIAPSLPIPEPFPLQPEPQYQPLETTTPEHHTTLPELVGRYGVAETNNGLPLPPAPAENVSPTGQQIPQHTSLKDLVEVPRSTETSNDVEFPIADLPSSPVAAVYEPLVVPPEDNQSNKPIDGSLTIQH